MAMAPTYHRDIVEAEQRLEAVQDQYLRRWGWSLTCNTPSSHWLWRRDFAAEDTWRAQHEAARPNPRPIVPYGVMMVPKDLALSITVRSLDEQPEMEDEAEA
jgi:hypothetical protein